MFAARSGLCQRATWCVRQWLTAHRPHSTLPESEGPLLSQLLEHRSILRLSGADTYPFLQGLVTADINALQNGDKTLYSFILNVQGRVLYDLFLYKGQQRENPTVLVECDKEVAPELLKILKRYKIRKKVNFSLIDDEYKVWAVMPHESMTADKMTFDLTDREDVQVATNDPRVRAFGWRLVLPSGVNASQVVEGATETVDVGLYDERRFQAGLAEGTTELPPGNCFPLESNLHFLNGVSFSKGCYIGQELTARTFHTGVTRKRIMPLKFTKEECDAATDDTVTNYKGQNSGKVRQRRGQYGLGLIRIGNVLGKDEGELITQDCDGEETGRAHTHVPPWWHTADKLLLQISSQNKTSS